MFCFFGHSKDKKLKELIYSAPYDRAKLKIWVSHCTQALQHDLLEYCNRATDTKFQDERKKVIKLLLKQLPALVTVANAEKFLTETQDATGANTKLWAHLQSYPLQSGGELATLFRKVSDYQNCFMKASKIKKVLMELPSLQEQSIRKLNP